MVGEPNLYAFSRQVLYGSGETRRRVATDLAHSRDQTLVGMLVETIFTDERPIVRVRSLEVLGSMVALGDDRACEIVSAMLPRPNR